MFESYVIHVVQLSLICSNVLCYYIIITEVEAAQNLLAYSVNEFKHFLEGS